MSQKDDWFRSENWKKEDQELFESKLSKARGSFNKAQYLRIKASYMSRSKKPEIREAAREVFKRVINEYPTEIAEVKQSYEQLGESYQFEGKYDEAEKMYRMTIKIHNKNADYQNFNIYSEFFLAELLVLSNDKEKNKEAEIIFNELIKRKHYFMFNDQIFRYYSSRARLSKKLGKADEAAIFAAHAIKTANNGQQPQLPRHPTVGLVNVSDNTLRELMELAGDVVIPDETPTEVIEKPQLTIEQAKKEIFEIILKVHKLIPTSSSQPEKNFENSIWGLGEGIRQILVKFPKLRKDKELQKEIVDICLNKFSGRGRESFLMLLSKSFEEYASQIITQIDDINVTGHVISAMLTMQAAGYTEQIKPFINHKMPWIRKSALRYVEKYK